MLLGSSEYPLKADIYGDSQGAVVLFVFGEKAEDVELVFQLPPPHPANIDAFAFDGNNISVVDEYFYRPVPVYGVKQAWVIVTNQLNCAVK